MAGFFLYVSNTISMDGGHLCFHEIQTEFGTPSENQNISCSVHGRYVIVYNERRPEVVYPNYYSEFAYNEVCEVEVYGEFDIIHNILIKLVLCNIVHILFVCMYDHFLHIFYNYYVMPWYAILMICKKICML